MNLTHLILCLWLLAISTTARSQERVSSSSILTEFPFRFFLQVQQTTQSIESKLVAQSTKALHKLAAQEKRLKRQLAKQDSLKAEEIFGDIDHRYQLWQDALQQPSGRIGVGGEYLPNLDTITTSLQFLSTQSQLLPNGATLVAPAQDALGSVRDLQGRLQQTASIQQYVQAREQQLKARLQGLGVTKAFQQFQAQAYYYRQQIQEYKQVLQDPSRLQAKAIALLQKLPAFKQFLQEHSQLASLFRLPGNYASSVSLAGLQTRSSVQALLQDRVTAGGPNAMANFQQNIQDAQAQLSAFKDRLHGLAGGVIEDMPDFKPNPQKTKTFLQRLEYGTDLQNQSSNYWFPITTDIGLSVGYKLNDKSVIGIGASYKVGWGRDTQHIAVTHEGVGLRSFAELLLKGSFFASGGFEYNYQEPFVSFTDLRGYDRWQQSGLVGVSKIVSLKSKLFKKTRLQLLWDFLSYQQVPRSPALKFRVGYHF